MELKEKLTLLRKKKEMSQQELAETLGVSRQAVSRWEVGASVPSMENLLALSKLFDVPVHELAGGAGPEKAVGTEPAAREEKMKLARYRILVRVLSGILAAIVVMGVLTLIWWKQNRTDSTTPAEQNIVDIEDLEEERIDPNAVLIGPSS